MDLASSSSPLGETEPVMAGMPPYSRASIADDEELPPFELAGLKRTVFLVMYGTIVATAVLGFAYICYFNPLFALTALALGYVFDNLAFSCGHLGFHTEFVEIPERGMKTLWHHSFIHHYRNTGVFHETWLETRMSYFFDPQAELSVKSIVKDFAIIVLCILLAYFVHPVLGIGVYAAQAIPLLMQSTVHEWYHNPLRSRKTFYSFPVYWFFTLLEKLSIASTKNHMIHHRHGLDDLDDVDHWLDLYIPFGERLPTHLWKKALSLHEPGETHMTRFARRGPPFMLYMGFRLLATVTIIAAYFLIVR